MFVLPPDWSGCGLTPVKGVLAEAATAEHAWRENKDLDVRWKAGQSRGMDVYAINATSQITNRRDAKSVTLKTIDGEENIVLARRDAQRFDENVVDFVTLVLLNRIETGFHVSLDDRIIQMGASARILALWDVPVDAMNGLLPQHRPGIDPTWRNAHIRLSRLTEFSVVALEADNA